MRLRQPVVRETALYYPQAGWVGKSPKALILLHLGIVYHLRAVHADRSFRSSTSMKRTWWIVVLLCAAAGLLWLPKTLIPHSVTLTWQAPALPDGVRLNGYNVYRRVADGGFFVKIADNVPGPPYEDRMVSSDKKYVYAVTSVDQSGRESRFSATVQVVVP